MSSVFADMAVMRISAILALHLKSRIWFNKISFGFNAMTITASSLHSEKLSGSFVELPGVRLWFTDSGGSGVPLVLLHANTGTVASWAHQIAPFTSAGYRVIAFDRRGWGHSHAQALTGVQPGSVAEDLDALVDYLKLPAFHLLGIAGGGFVALDYASWRPERLLSLVVAASNGQFVDPEMLDIYQRIAIPGLTGNPSLREFLEVGVSYRSENPSGFSLFAEMAHSARQTEAVAQPMRTSNTLQKISQIQTRTLILSGGADLLAPPALMRFWSKNLPSASFSNIEDGGHSLNWERPNEFNKKVLQFLLASS
ncbi:MAG: alpha/beta hydrolase [Betaproteobacteria bacterium]|nr:alpha/beta hydrolase [Betaproteobacteria bacterium]